MAWPTSVTLDLALKNVDKQAVFLKTEFQRIRGLITSRPQIRRGAYSWVRNIQTALDIFDQAAAIPGVVQFVRDEKRDQALNVGAEFTAMRNAAAAVQAEIVNIIPTHNPSGALLLQTGDAQGNLSDLTLTVAEMSSLVPLLDAYIATVD